MSAFDRIIRVIIIDDENEAHQVMERLLIRVGGIEIVGNVYHSEDALALIQAKKPDIIFLDIQMPIKDGICVANDLKRNKVNSSVVFVTAYSAYAIEALKASAFDYLLKPVDVDDLRNVIDRYKMEKSGNTLEDKLEILIENYYTQKKLLFNTRAGCVILDENDIVYCSAEVNYTRFVLGGNRTEIITMNIGKVNKMLDNIQFFKLGRSYLINLTYLSKVDRGMKTCELIKGSILYKIKVPLPHLKELENLIKTR